MNMCRICARETRICYYYNDDRPKNNINQVWVSKHSILG